MSNRVLKLIPIKIVTKLMRSRVKMWGSKFGKELWDSLTVATRRDTIQQVKNDDVEDDDVEYGDSNGECCSIESTPPPV